MSRCTLGASSVPPYTPETRMIGNTMRSSGFFDLDIAVDAQGDATAVCLQASPDDLLRYQLYYSGTYGEATRWFEARMQAADVQSFPTGPRGAIRWAT